MPVASRRPRGPPPDNRRVVHPREPHGAISYLVLDGRDVAGSGLGVPEQVAQGLSARAYIYTDRPAYRPGQEVALRGVVREVARASTPTSPRRSTRSRSPTAAAG